MKKLNKNMLTANNILYIVLILQNAWYQFGKEHELTFEILSFVTISQVFNQLSVTWFSCNLFKVIKWRGSIE